MVEATSLFPTLWLDVRGESCVQPETWRAPLLDGINGPLSQDCPEVPNTLGLPLASGLLWPVNGLEWWELSPQ